MTETETTTLRKILANCGYAYLEQDGAPMAIEDYLEACENTDYDPDTPVEQPVYGHSVGRIWIPGGWTRAGDAGDLCQSTCYTAGPSWATTEEHPPVHLHGSLVRDPQRKIPMCDGCAEEAGRIELLGSRE